MLQRACTYVPTRVGRARAAISSLANALLGWEREQRRLAGRRVRDGFQFRVAMAERLGNLDLFLREHVDQLQRVDDALALEMIVRHHESGLRVFGYVFDSSGPG